MKLLLDMSKSELCDYLTQQFNTKKFVCGQIFDWLVKFKDFDQMSNISKDLRATLQENCHAKSLEIVSTLCSKIDQTKKFLYKLTDGNIIEGVLMSYKFGNTLCVSTQVGCRMGCKFCASTLGGLVRNLTAGEILGQVLAVNALEQGTERLVTNVVLMGSGEPLDNFDNVAKFLQLVTDSDGINISARNISVSTCGLAPEIRRLADLNIQVNLVVSLHNPSNESRQQIMPIAKKYSIDEVMSAAKYYFEVTKRRIIFEYTLIDGQNDSYADALKLSHLLRNMSAHINLIRLNPVRETRLKSTSGENAKKFLEYLLKFKLSATLRRQMGTDIEGSCGQLRNQYVGQNTPVSSGQKHE